MFSRGQTAQSGMVALHPYPQTLRSAGGSHTLTRPHQRVRMTPFSSVYTLETPIPVPPPNPVKQRYLSKCLQLCDQT